MANSWEQSYRSGSLPWQRETLNPAFDHWFGGRAASRLHGQRVLIPGCGTSLEPLEFARLTAHDGPRFFAYRVWAFEHPLVRRLADEARGEWTFTAAPGGTQVSWTYTFSAKNGWAALPLSAIAQLLWRGYMDVCLDNTVRIMSAPASGA